MKNIFVVISIDLSEIKIFELTIVWLILKYFTKLKLFDLQN